MSLSPSLPHKHGHVLEKASNHVPEHERFQNVADTFRLLSDPNRLKIFWILCHGEECVINLAALMSMSSPSIAHHLKLLKMSGIVRSRREGKEVYYNVQSSEIVKTLHPLVERMMQLTCPQG